MVGPFINNYTYKSGVYCVNKLVSLITSELLKRKLRNDSIVRYKYVGFVKKLSVKAAQTRSTDHFDNGMRNKYVEDRRRKISSRLGFYDNKLSNCPVSLVASTSHKL